MNIPKGYKLVPVEPTAEMLTSEITPVLCLGNPETPRVEQWRRGLYTAMIAAAPTPPQPIYDESKERELFEAQFLLAPKRWASGYEDRDTNYRWKGWLACAQSRSKGGEVGHG